MAKARREAAIGLGTLGKELGSIADLIMERRKQAAAEKESEERLGIAKKGLELEGEAGARAERRLKYEMDIGGRYANLAEQRFEQEKLEFQTGQSWKMQERLDDIIDQLKYGKWLGAQPESVQKYLEGKGYGVGEEAAQKLYLGELLGVGDTGLSDRDKFLQSQVVQWRRWFAQNKNSKELLEAATGWNEGKYPERYPVLRDEFIAEQLRMTPEERQDFFGAMPVIPGSEEPKREPVEPEVAARTTQGILDRVEAVIKDYVAAGNKLEDLDPAKTALFLGVTEQEVADVMSRFKNTVPEDFQPAE